MFNVLRFKIITYIGNVPIWQFILCVLLVAIFMTLYSYITNRSNIFVLLCWIVNLSVVFSITFLGRKFGMVHNSPDKLLYTYAYIIEHGIGWAKYEVIFNMLLFVPTGILLVLDNSNQKAIICSFLFSLFIETIQLITGTGLFEICDLIDNTLGGIIGIGLVVLFRKVKLNLINQKSCGGEQ